MALAPDRTDDEKADQLTRGEMVRVLLMVDEDLRDLTGLTGDEPTEDLHSLFVERLSFLPTAERDQAAELLGQASDTARGVAPLVDAEPVPAGEVIAFPLQTGAAASPTKLDAAPGDPGTPDDPQVTDTDGKRLFRMDERDYSRAQAVQYWHTNIEPVISLAKQASEAIDAAMQAIDNPNATPGEVRGTLGRVKEYDTALTRTWEGIKSDTLGPLVDDLQAIHDIAQTPDEKTQITALIEMVKSPRELAQYHILKTGLDEAVVRYAAETPAEATRRLYQEPDEPDESANSTPSPYLP